MILFTPFTLATRKYMGETHVGIMCMYVLMGRAQLRSSKLYHRVNDICLIFNLRYIRLNKSKLPFLFSMFSPLHISCLLIWMCLVVRTFFNIDKLCESGFAVHYDFVGWS